MRNETDSNARALLERPALRALVAIALLTALVGVFFAVRAGRGGDGDPAARAGGSPAASGSRAPGADLGPLDSQPPLVGQPAPDFRLRDVDGSVVRLSDLRGKVVYVNFWASWCVPCRKELPAIQRVYDEKHADGLEVLTVNWQDDADTARSFFSSRSLTLPLLLDDGGVYEQYKLRGLPDSFFVDREGKIASLQYGEVTEDNIRDRLRTAGLP